jgi:putative NIF3 family GTP cyclohydrolase 1 type 2
MSSVTTVGEVLTLIEGWYDPNWAESWDSVGFIGGDKDTEVVAIHIAVDATLGVAQ